jgi:hypothetical protein
VRRHGRHPRQVREGLLDGFPVISSQLSVLRIEKSKLKLKTHN